MNGVVKIYWYSAGPVVMLILILWVAAGAGFNDFSCAAQINNLVTVQVHCVLVK